MAELLCNPKVLLTARAELEETIGREKQVQESDIVRLPYLEAVIKETLRMHPPVPLLLPRRAGADAEISGTNRLPLDPTPRWLLHLMLGSLINCFDWKLEDRVKPETMNVEEKFRIALEKAKPLRAIAIPVPV
ncbi:hypothetical protein SLE2022_088800 [Rubroshorea leprosula]